MSMRESFWVIERPPLQIGRIWGQTQAADVGWITSLDEQPAPLDLRAVGGY
jgi:hypothetical protein